MNTDWPTEVIKPRRLRPGSRMAIVSPCWGGPASFPHRYAAGKQQLVDALGVDLVEMPHVAADANWLEMHPEHRAADLMQAFRDPTIDAIISSIGGDDAYRLIPYIDLKVIAENPKIFLGYSDTTVLGFGFLKAGLSSFYGPSVMSGFAENGGVLPYMIDSVRRCLCSTDAIGTIEPNTTGWTVERLPWSDPQNQTRRRALRSSTGPRLIRGVGKVRGNLIGGCADTIEQLKNTSWWPPLERWRGALLFYGTSEDAPSPELVKQWLKGFADLGILQVLGGILFARPGGQPDVGSHQGYDCAILEALDEVGLGQLPVVTNLDFGHTDPMFNLPYGALAQLDCAGPELRILTGAVS